MSGAFVATEVLVWPKADGKSPLRDLGLRNAQWRFNRLADEVCERTFAATRRSIAEPFVEAVSDVLGRIGGARS